MAVKDYWRRFVHETLVDGALYHVLECGHSHPARNREDDGLPVGARA